MIQELIQFTDSLLADDPNLLEKNLRPREGLHLLVHLRGDGSFEKIDFTYVEKGVEYEQPSGEPLEGEYSELLQTCLKYQLFSSWIDANKAMDMGGGGKKIHSASPFVVAFKKENLVKIPSRYPIYFKAVRELQLKEDEEEWWQLSECVERFCQDQLNVWLVGLVISKQGKKTKGVSQIPFKDLKDSIYISIYLANVPIEDLKETHERYLEAKLFNTDVYNQEIEGKGGEIELHGVSNYLNGLNSKKPFFLHHSSPFYKKLSGRIKAEHALRLYQFEQLLKQNRILPNPLPLFIYKEELNQRVVSIFRGSGFKFGYKEIISKLYEKGEKELANYYLFYFGRGKEILDFDFVSAFKFRIDWSFTPIFSYKKGEWPPSIELNNRFILEKELLPIIFDNKLIVRNKEGAVVSRRYFNELEGKSFGYPEQNTFRLIGAYRMAWYDFIYKSRENAISGKMFQDMMLSGILEGIRRDEAYKSTYSIKQKANFWFGLNKYFDTDYQNFNGIDMASKIPELLEKARAMRGRKKGDGESLPYLTNDHEFAFLAGQVIYFLLSQSKADQKTHALFHPFLLKTNLESFQIGLKDAFKRYGYDIGQNASVNRVMADVLSYELQTLSFPQLQPTIIAGYLADNVFYEKIS